MSKVIEINGTITVGTLAEKLEIPVSRLIGELMKNGVMVTVNERIDFDTAQIILTELKLEDIELKNAAENKEIFITKKIQTGDEIRPPVVAVMGHVDHGKTSLLDAIRGSTVTKAEAGGITQHISAYQIEHAGRAITLLDTPGHEAFAALREHGAHLTDVVLIVVAADDGVKPQTIEAIRFAKKAGVKIVAVITKADKPEANPNLVKQQLAEQDILVEGWGGDTVILEVSAKTGEGIKELLDMILLVTDVEDLKADSKGPAEGLIIEAHMEKGRGPVAIALIQQGTLRTGASINAGNTYAKIRSLEDTSGKIIKSAGPATPVKIIGFKSLPDFGDEFLEHTNERAAKILSQKATQQSKEKGNFNSIGGTELLRMMNRQKDRTEFTVIIKTDVQGSLTSVVDSLKALDTEEVVVRVVGSGVGAVTENDIHLAHTSHAVIYGFNVLLPTAIKQLASRDKVPVRLYKIIYELIDDVKSEMSDLLAPQIVEEELGRLIVKGIFKITKTEIICGGEVTKGKIVVPSLAKVVRDKQELAEVEVIALKHGPQEVKEVLEGAMCGVSFKSKARIDLQEGDRLEFFTRKTVTRSL